MPQGFNFEESLDEEDDDEENMPDLVPGQVAARVTPSVIVIGQDGGEDCSTMSSSIGKPHMERAVEKETGKEEKEEERKAGESGKEGAEQADDGWAADGKADYRSVKGGADGTGDADGDAGVEAESKLNENRSKDGDNGRGGEAETKQQATTLGVNEDDNRDTYSEIDSQAFADEGLDDDFEDDDAFIERLSQMVDFADLVDNEGAAESHVEDRESGSAEADQSGHNLRRSRRTIRPPKRLIEEMGGASVEQRTTWNDCLIQVYESLNQEMALVGAGVGGGFGHTRELDVKKYNEAMQSTDLDDLAKWVKGIDEEHARFLFDDVWVAVLKGDYENVIPITMTWALKLKASGVVRARCNVRGFEQIPQIHYDPVLSRRQ